MPRVRLLLCLSLLLLPRLAAAAPRAAPGTTLINGRAFYDLERWASLNRLTARANGPGGEILLTNRWTRLAFKADSKRAEFDGVAVWLSLPVLARGQGHWLAKLDADKLLAPLLQPPRLAAGRKIRTIAVGAGHGGKDPGNQEGRRQEKDYTLRLALELETRLKRAGFQVIMIRRRDEFIDLADRPALARKKGADLYLSLHYNSAARAGDSARGVEVYCLTPAGASSTNDGGNHGWPAVPGNKFDAENASLAWCLQRELTRQLELEDRGLRRARFLELTQMKMPAVLIEGGFMTHPQDAATIYSESARRRLAEAITDGVLAYKRLVERAKP